MSETGRLRRLLDEHGCVHLDRTRTLSYIDNKAHHYTSWTAGFGNMPKTHNCTYHECGGETRLTVEIHGATPEDAICATLPISTCRNISYRLDKSRFHCSECGFGCWVKNVASGMDELPSYCPNCGARIVDGGGGR